MERCRRLGRLAWPHRLVPQPFSVDLPSGPFGGGYPRRKAPLFRKFARADQKLHLIRADSHSQETKEGILQILKGEQLDYLFLDGDHTYC